MWKTLVRIAKRNLLQDPSLKFASNASRQYVKNLELFIDNCGKLETHYVQQRKLLTRLGLQRTRVAIMGVRSHGKTTVVTSLIRHRLLPSGGPPITAFPCIIMKSSERENWAEIEFLSGRRKIIPATADDIEDWVSLTDRHGKENNKARQCKLLRLYLSAWPFSKNLEIVDLQGDDDSAGEIVTTIMPYEADLIIYVLRINFREGEQGFEGKNEFMNEEFLNRLSMIQKVMGTAGVRLLINVFFAKVKERMETEEGRLNCAQNWEIYQRNVVPEIRKQLMIAAQQYPFLSDINVSFVAAGPAELAQDRSLNISGSEGYGFDELRKQLTETAPREISLKSRLYKVRSAVTPGVEMLSKRIIEQKKWENEYASYKQKLDERNEQQEALIRYTETIVRSNISELTRAVNKISSDLTSTMRNSRYVLIEPYKANRIIEIARSAQGECATSIVENFSQIAIRPINRPLLEEDIAAALYVGAVRVDYELPGWLANLAEDTPFGKEAEQLRSKAASAVSSAVWQVTSHWRRASGLTLTLAAHV